LPIDRETYPSLDAVGLTQAVADGETTAEQLLDLARSRHDQVNPEINAVVSWFDQPVFRSVSPDVVPGPLHGVPFLLKDLGHDLVGHPTSRGSRALRLVVPRENSTVVERWLDAGLVITGKTNTPEFGAKGITESELFGPARNPWNTDHSPGGSSGGAAAAVAAGIVPCAGASDGGGSIRIPASCCGLFGLKASRGLIAGGPAAAEKLGGTATDGAISWSVRDTALMLDVLAGPAPASPFAAAMPAEPFSDQVGRDPGRLRIAWCATSSITEPDDEAVRAVRSTAELLAGLGHEVVELDRQPIDDAAMLKDFLATWFVYIAREVELAKFAGAATDDAFEEDTRLMAALGRATPSLELLALIDARQQHVRRLADFHSRHAEESGPALRRLQDVAASGGNTFAELMEAVRVCSLGQITEAFFTVGGQYRRAM